MGRVEELFCYFEGSDEFSDLLGNTMVLLKLFKVRVQEIEGLQSRKDGQNHLVLLAELQSSSVERGEPSGKITLSGTVRLFGQGGGVARQMLLLSGWNITACLEI